MEVNVLISRSGLLTPKKVLCEVRGKYLCFNKEFVVKTM